MDKPSTDAKIQAPKQPTEQGGPQVDNQQKDPSDWVTGSEPMTGAQASYLKTLCEEAKEDFDPKMSKADASRRIDALRNRSKAS